MELLSPHSAGYDYGDCSEDWAGQYDADGMLAAEVNTIHAQQVTAVTSQATSAAWCANVAAKNAAELAQWVNFLWGQMHDLQLKVKELEDWKKKTLEEIKMLRKYHMMITKKVSADGDVVIEDLPPVPKAKSMPLLLADHMEHTAPPTWWPPLQDPLAPSPKRKVQKAVTIAAVGPPPGLEELPGKAASTPATGNVTAAPVRGAEPQLPTQLSPMSVDSIGMDEAIPEGVQVERLQINGLEWERAEWRIGHLSTKLKNCMGRALVSSPFRALGLDDLRLMIFPDGKDDAKGPRSKRQKDQYAKKVTEGPLEGCLKLKVPECPPPHILEYYLKIGNVQKGPFRHNFQENTVNGCTDFGVDWLKQVEPDQSLKVALEVHRVNGD